MSARLFIVRCAQALVLLFGAAGYASAQGWTAGVKGGIGQGGFTKSREFSWDRATPATAVFVNHSLTDWLSFQPELAHVRKVGQSEIPGSTLTLTTDFLQLPLLLQVKLPSTLRLMPFLLAGPNVGVKLNCTLSFVGGGVRSSNDCDSDRGVQSHRFDFGAMGGVGVNWFAGAATFGIEGRYAAGLRSFVVPLDERTAKSYGWSVMASVSLPMRRLISSPPETAPPPVAAMPPLPLIPPPAEVLERPVPSAPPVTVVPSAWTRRVSLNAVDADARTLLLAVARETGLNMVVSSDVNARVSITLSNVLGVEAVQAILDVAGLSLMRPSMSGVQPAVVFYDLPIDVNKATPEVITARFGVSAEMAKFIAASRAP